ncbi:type II toxin-antitoxin system RelE/ParE family toxin [Candidatus Pacearchaeota archaeon]|nr:type II toxin-antitoxin system RelE/ParE family toxin [Candidatus Pacearchaeota archaeon]
MIYKIKFEKRAFQELDKLDQIISRRILRNIKELKKNFHTKDVKRLKGKDIYRLRVGNYRVLFYIENDLISILKVGHRKKIYKY